MAGASGSAINSSQAQLEEIIRCPMCSKMLFKSNLPVQKSSTWVIQIKCPRCHTIINWPTS